MKLRQAFNWTAAVLAFALSGASALAAPVTQSWTNLNPDNPQGLFDEMAFHFVSQSNGQTGFSNVALRNPLNGWVLQGFDPQLTYAKGASGATINFDLTFEGAASDTVQWEVWYYLDHKKLGGALYTGNVGRTSFGFTVLEDAGQPPSVPEPATALLVALALGGCAVARKRRGAVEATADWKSGLLLSAKTLRRPPHPTPQML